MTTDDRVLVAGVPVSLGIVRLVYNGWMLERERVLRINRRHTDFVRAMPKFVELGMRDYLDLRYRTDTGDWFSEVAWLQRRAEAVANVAERGNLHHWRGIPILETWRKVSPRILRGDNTLVPLL